MHLPVAYRARRAHKIRITEPLKPGDELELRWPDGPLSENAGLFIELEPSVTGDHLPIGTEIWKVGRLPVRLQSKSFEVRR